MTFPSGDMLTIETLIAVAVVMVAGVTRGFTGFGSVLIMVPIYALMYGPVVTVATVLLLEVAVSADSFTRVAKVVPWRTMIPIWVAAWLAVPFGTWVLLITDADILRRMMSMIVAFLAFLLLIGWRYRGSHKLVYNFCVGAMSGVLNGSTGFGGPPVIFYLLSGPTSTVAARAGLIGNVFVVSMPTVTILILSGALDTIAIWRIAVIFPFFLIATLIGNRLFHTASEKIYRRAASWLLLIIAIGTFVAE